MKIELRDKELGKALGLVDAAAWAKLQEILQLEHPGDRDYWIDAATLDLLTDAEVGAPLVELLRSALGEREGFHVEWAEEA